MSLTASAADTDPNSSKSTGPVVLLSGSYASPGEKEGVMHLPGREYRSGDGWWALVCAAPAPCELRTTRLDVTAKPHEAYDSAPVPGQLLTFSPPAPAGSLLIFKPFRLANDKLKLRPGPLTTYYPGNPSRLKRSASSPGTMEGEIALPDNRLIRFVPTLLMPAQKQRGFDEPSSHALALELHFDGKRQSLGTFEFGIEGPFGLKPSDYLLWAGDLDGDGQPDFLVSLDFAGTNIVLLLSSLAKEGEIAGEAGRFHYFPIESPGC